MIHADPAGSARDGEGRYFMQVIAYNFFFFLFFTSLFNSDLFLFLQNTFMGFFFISESDSKLFFFLRVCEWRLALSVYLTLKRLGGPKRPPLDISRDYSATRKALAATLYDFFLSSFPHILTPNLWRPGVRFWSYVTFCTCTSDRKWLQNVILCTKSMQIELLT